MKRLALAAGVVVLAAGGHQAVSAAASTSGSSSAAISYAEQQIGKPYLWGATGPDAFDCSGLAMKAYRAAGVGIARTSQQQWATERHVPGAKPGELVFFAGVDGTRIAPGHVGIVTGKHTMIDAYGSGTDVRQESFGLPGSAPGLQRVVGYTNPLAGSR